jgi:CheY-like chemotaxis protein
MPQPGVQVGQFATQILQDLGYETWWAANAEEALMQIGAGDSRFDAVFSDVVMPGIGGLELARRLKRENPDLPVVLATGYSDALAQEGVHGLHLLQKPYSAEQVSRCYVRRSGAEGSELFAGMKPDLSDATRGSSLHGLISS